MSSNIKNTDRETVVDSLPTLDVTQQQEDDCDFDGKLLHQACLWDNSDLLSDLLFGDELRHLNSQDSQGRTALHAAVLANSLNCARLLLMNGANPNIEGSGGQTTKSCLHLACERGQVEMVLLLIEFNANLFSKDSNGFTAMDLAEQHHHQSVVKVLENALLQQEHLRADLYESLVIAVHKGDVQNVQQLLLKATSLCHSTHETEKIDQNSDVIKNDHTEVSHLVNHAPNGSNTLLFKACQEGHLSIVKLLIEAGSDGRQHPVTKYSPLYISAYHGRLAICELLLEHFPELAAIYTVEHWLPIHAAAMNNHQDIVKLLLTFPYPKRVMQRFASHCNILSLSESTNSNSFHSRSEHLLDSHSEEQFVYLMPFDLNAQDIAGQSVLYLATLLGNQSLIEFLLNYRLKAILYSDYVQHCTQNKLNANSQSNDVTTTVLAGDGSELDLFYFDDLKSDIAVDNIDNQETSNSSSCPDITVIDGPESGHTSQQANEPLMPDKNVISGETSSSSIASSIQRLLDKLSPGTSPSKQNTPSSDQLSPASNSPSKSIPQKYPIIRPQVYMVNPIKVDLYCNYRMETALHCAVKKSHYSIASILLENGADANLPINGHITSPLVITRVSHFNHNFFLPTRSISNSLRDLASTEGREGGLTSIYSSSSSINSDSNKCDKERFESHPSDGSRFRSTSLREAIRNRDKVMVDLLLRFGARDELSDEDNEDDTTTEEESTPKTALAIAFSNGDYHFVSKLLSLKCFTDNEFKINRKAFDIVGTSFIGALNKSNIVNNITVSSMFPSNPVMVDWRQLGIKNMETGLQRHLSQWLTEAAWQFNVKLKLNQNQDFSKETQWNTALAAITRVDLSKNSLTTVPICLFTDLPSMKILNLSMNKLQTLPELGIGGCKEKIATEDKKSMVGVQCDSSSSSSSSYASSSPKSSLNFFTRMRKSHSVTSALSSSSHNARSKLESYRRSDSAKSRLSEKNTFWDMPFLEELYLQDNQLECLPSSLFQLPELKILDLSNNKLRALPPFFWFAPKLYELNLSLNLLCDLPLPHLCSSSTCGSPTVGSVFIDSSSDSVVSNDSNVKKQDTFRGMSKSITVTSNMCSNLKSARTCFSGSPNDNITTAKSWNNLVPFELCLEKPWSSRVDILSETLENNFPGGNNLLNDSNRTSQCSQQEFLHSANTEIDAISMSKQQTCQLKQLNLSHNGFDRVPTMLSCLATHLTHLNLSYNRLTTFFDPEYILGHYPMSLKHLDLSHNLMEEWLVVESPLENEDASTYRGHCCIHSSSTQKSLSESNIIQCPFKQHSRLEYLKTLVLTKNYLKCIIVTREELFELVDRYLVNQKMAHLSFNLISNFENRLKSRLTKKSATFGSLDDLLLPDDSDNLNMNLKASRYTKLFFPNLSMLDMANNQLTEIPKSISYLSQLSVFNLSGNMDLTTLPPEMGLLSKLWNLNTRGCLNLNEPLRTMIISKTYKTCDIISYLNSILENSKPYTRMKLMLVGIQGIGKTSLLEQLRHEGTSRKNRPPDHWGKRMGNKSMNLKTPRGVTLSTVGVDLNEWIYDRRPLRGARDRDRSLSRSRMPTTLSHPKNLTYLENEQHIGPITFRTWDFGGQREYYATHQYFLSKRSIYLVVWKITDGEKGIESLHSWLVNIQSRAPNSPVIIVGTHYDLVKEYYPPFFSSDLQNIIRERFMSDSVDADKRGLPRVVASVEVSAKTRHNIRLLANLIYETASELRTSGSKERLLEQKVPATYLALEEVVAYLTYERKSASLTPVLYSEQYRTEVVRALKERHNLAFRDYSELQQATRFLHENGVMLHYEDANLKDLYFLDPQWLCDILAHVVTIREINPYAKNGFMKTEHLKQLFKNTTIASMDIQSYLLSLLNKFELALTWDNRTLLIPSLLPTEEQLCAGHPGSDIMIPLRSRLKLRNSLDELGVVDTQIEFHNQIQFQELRLAQKSKLEQVHFGEQPFKGLSSVVTALVRHNESIHRILLLTYVPCGFWPRLITRVFGDETVIEIVRSFYHLPPGSKQNLTLTELLNTVQAKWHCWQSGFGLRYLDTFLLRVKEFGLLRGNGLAQATNLDQSNLSPCKSYYPFDYQRMKFHINPHNEGSCRNNSSLSTNGSQWSEAYIAPQGATMIEIYLPNQPLKVDIYTVDDTDQDSAHPNRQETYILEPNQEMLTKLLVLIVEHVDTLLEDWYPSLGTRFIHTSDGRFLITRVVPCTMCMCAFIQETFDSNTNYDNHQNATTKSTIVSPDTAQVNVNLVDFYKSEVKKATLHATESKPEFCDSAISTLKSNVDSNDSGPLSSTTMSLYHPVSAFMVEECILAVYEDRRLECPTHGRLRMEKLAPDIMFVDLKDTFRIDRNQLRFGKLLGRGSFGFVFRGVYTHKKNNFKVTLTQHDSSINKREVTNSKFYLPNSANEQMMESFDVALKLLQPIRVEQWSNGIRKLDMEAYSAMKSKWERDPLQYSCKAYCTARTELNILSSLKHPNIAAIIGICPKPLALVLTLAPQGSLDVHTKAYRRSGVRIVANVLQQAFLQISKALEYLHQHHIIYRDLKSENVLVWSFPSPLSLGHHTLSANNLLKHCEIHLKLADYGISRSSLPTGTKGFGGTEGFMAPEIMLYNGEEEYTEKVDCFSFAMFMYELCTLRFPFEGQEFAIRESILDGIRPALTQRDLQYLPESFIDLMIRCWAQEPTERPTISQVVSIISAPEFCSLRDVAIFADHCAIICATGFGHNSNNLTDASKHAVTALNDQQEFDFTICLSKVGKQVDLVKSNKHKWSSVGYRLSCENLVNRTITSACIINGDKLWLGDSQARLHLHHLPSPSSNGECSDEHFNLLCMIQLESDNPASLTALKSICWLAHANLLAICSNSGKLWLLSLNHLQEQMPFHSNKSFLTSSALNMKEINYNGSMVLCTAYVDCFERTTVSSPKQVKHLVELWCGQPEGKMAVIQFQPENLFINSQAVVDHYQDNFIKRSLSALYIGSDVAVAERNDVFLLVSSVVESIIWSVLYTGFVVYQWDCAKRQIVHRLDCSKLAPCSESLLSISIEDHLKPGNCQITALALNEHIGELYVGTNLGSIIVVESRSLKPITVFRPYIHEVKFIITLPSFNYDTQPIELRDIHIENKIAADKIILRSSAKYTLRSLHQVSSNLWPFNKKDADSGGKNATKLLEQEPEGSKKHEVHTPFPNRPFVTIGRGYRNLLDRFCGDATTVKPNYKHKESSSLHAIIWDSGNWNFD